eukprot:TRINITY_DN1677_c0_g2_i2.p2 TRINITY_DN1677_c0_g2~~TRINITY_DN1677_c0_g2_i2.p2  ORF type:complete len:100 (-),score=8.38 TRINITY_DN1677_c0_g2_i2:619-918(-)
MLFRLCTKLASPFRLTRIPKTTINKRSHLWILGGSLFTTLCFITSTSSAESKSKIEDGGKTPVEPRSLFDFQVTTIDGELVSLDRFKGKVCLVVNVASR